MRVNWQSLSIMFRRVFPENSSQRKLLYLLGIILLFEGASVIVLYSYQGVVVGVISLVIGAIILLLLGEGALRRMAMPDTTSQKQEETVIQEPPAGMKLVDDLVRWIGNDYVIIAAGLVVIASVVVWNLLFSPRGEFGDLDTLSLIFGLLIAVFPWLSKRYKVEMTFSLIFIGLVVLLLVVPQALSYVREDAGSSAGNWYVEYMLAAPFSGILQLIGIESSSSGNAVMIEFHDGTHQTLGISAYCAGLYSFSIFLAAFFSFVLVFERLSNRMLVFVLALGLLIAYLGNLFRMVVIGVVGYYYGLDALLWAHENAGWVIFLSWSSVFWYFLLGYVSKHSKSRSVVGAT